MTGSDGGRRFPHSCYPVKPAAQAKPGCIYGGNEFHLPSRLNASNNAQH